MKFAMFAASCAFAAGLLAGTAAAQDSAPSCRPTGAFAQPDYTSVEPLADGRVTFRLCAPDADAVKLVSNDVEGAIPTGFAPGTARGLDMQRDASGLWSVTTPLPIAPDTHRYWFEIDGARVPDPMASTFSRERTGIASTFEVAGDAGAFQAWDKDVPHGAVSRVEYWSGAIGAPREAYIYTPPGYMNGTGDYPVLYLVHGAGDSAQSWSTVGRANVILDNLIAAGEAVPMIVVMPFGHTPALQGQAMLTNAAFGEDLKRDLIPYVDANFRTRASAQDRAMAGLSMGGAHTLRFGLPDSETFAYIGVFSMGLGLNGPDDIAAYEAQNAAGLARSKNNLDLVYYAMGTDDFLYGSVAPTRAMLDRQGIEHVYNESAGGHTWINWRRYLADFAPRLFR